MFVRLESSLYTGVSALRVISVSAVVKTFSVIGLSTILVPVLSLGEAEGVAEDQLDGLGDVSEPLFPLPAHSAKILSPIPRVSAKKTNFVAFLFMIPVDGFRKSYHKQPLLK